jgi:hypothetical protein
MLIWYFTLTFSKPILYLSTEANDPMVATFEGATYAKALEDLSFALEDASPGESAERIYVFANGARRASTTRSVKASTARCPMDVDR